MLCNVNWLDSMKTIFIKWNALILNFGKDLKCN